MRKAKKLCAFIMACGMALGVVGCAGSQAMADTPTEGYEMTITIRPYENQTDKLNNLLLSIFDDSQKQRYTKN